MKTLTKRICTMLLCAAAGCGITCCTMKETKKETSIDPSVVQSTIQSLIEKHSEQAALIERGVRQTARLWRETDGDAETFKTFCLENYIADPAEKEQVFLKISDYLEGISGHYNEMSLRLMYHLHRPTGPLHAVDEMFSAFSPSTHLQDDFYKTKIAFMIMLNFPHYTLEEKEQLGTDRKAWAYARLGDRFTERVPAEALQVAGNAESDADLYTSEYNIYMGQVTDRNGKHNFPKDMILLSHWNLRDEIKANYNKGDEGTEKQRTVYEVMKRIVAQDIPTEVINSDNYEWDPFKNEIRKEGQTVTANPESTVRYQKMLNNFKAMQVIDQYTGNTYIDRKFSEEMEVALDDVTQLFDQFLTAPELQAVGKIISKQLGRDLEAYDIWYDGFKARSNLDEQKLDKQTQALYPNAEALDKDLPNILVKAGFSPERANYLAEKITVDPARGSGHAWGAAMKGQQSRLRTRIPETGMNYKGYNIAVHEFGHNVEQTISLYDVDYYMLSGVPNTAFTEALAFVFQKRDLEFLGIKNEDPDAEAMNVLDKIWSMYEITGVSMLDIAVWKWMYAHPNATVEELRDTVIDLSKEIWNHYYAPVFGVKDETVLAVYSHMISYPLYLSAYAFGQIIEFQLEQYLKGKDFASEVGRIFSQGRLTPNQWMLQGTNQPLTVEPMLNALREVLKK